MAKILYVEDNEDNVYMLKPRLERAGFEIVMALDCEQGLAVAHDQRPDLILMDLRLPVLDGWQATRCLKEPGGEANNSGHRLVSAGHIGRP